MVEVTVNPGICGLKTVIRVNSEDMQMAAVDICTDCPNLKPMEAELKEVDAYVECFAKICDTETYRQANKYCRHNACTVPAAILKGIEAACGLALPKDAEIKIEKLDT